VGWRLVALSGLAWLIFEIAEALTFTSVNTMMTESLRGAMRLEIVPLATSLALVGLVLAISPLGRRRQSSRWKPNGNTRLSVVLATAAGLAYFAVGFGNFPYLVLLALEFVQNAMTRAPLVARPIVFDRLHLACLEALPGLIGCLLTALWIDDDLRSSASDPASSRVPRSTLGVIYRTSTMILAAIGSAFVLMVSIPKLSPPLAEGFATLLDPSIVWTIVVGFSGLAAGLSARGAASLADRDGSASFAEAVENPWPRRTVGGIVGFGAIEVIAQAVLRMRQDYEEHWYILFNFDFWLSAFGFRLLTQPGESLMAVVALWLIYRLIRLFVAKSSDRSAALDLIIGDRLALGRFLGWWVGLTILMPASLPLLGILGMTLTHHLILWVTS
jgi:hypothetical protein